ncbi:MAG: hypothetical protein Q9217_004463 [Psora testacea]
MITRPAFSADSLQAQSWSVLDEDWHFGATNMQIDQDRLKAENQNFAVALRERTRKHQQTQELYDRLKRKEMTAATQSAAHSAALESVDDALGGLPSRHAYPSRPQPHRDVQPYPVDHNGVERIHTHQRSGSSHSQGSGGMMPPPPPPRSGFQGNSFGFGNTDRSARTNTVDTFAANVAATPSSHRAQLGSFAQSAGHLSSTGYRPVPNNNLRVPSHTTPLQRQPLSSVHTNSVSKNGLSGYGMSAGAKIGRQQNSRMGNTNQPAQGYENEHPAPRLSQPPQQPNQSGDTYY